MTWNEYQLSKILNLIGGGTPKTSNPDYWGGSIPWLSVADFNTGYRRVYSSEKAITEKALKESSTAILKKGQLIISARGTVGVVAQLGRDMAFNQSCYGIDAKPDKAINDFLYYLLKYTVSHIRRITHGAVFDTITRESFDHISIKLPPLPEQKAIAHILGALDDKIELNRKMNETLEAMARAIFKSWFVDFDPIPGHGPHKEWQDSPLGWIPKGWRVSTIGDIAENIRHGVRPEEITPATPYIGLEHMPRKCIALSEWGHVEDVTSNKFQFRQGDILFGKLRPYFHKVGIAPINGICSTDILVVVPKQPLLYGLVLSHLSSNEFVGHADATSTGTKMPRTNWASMARYQIAIPPDDIGKSFTEKIEAMIKFIYSNIHQSHTLAASRDALLPKLLSGEIRVKEAEKFTEVRL